MSEALDAEDAARVVAGDAEAFAGIVRRWQGPLVTLAHRFCRDHARAEDLAQAALVRAFRRLPQWRGEGPLRSWLLALAVNVFRSELRRLPRPEQPLEEAGEVGDRAASGPPAEAALAARAREAVAALPEPYRSTLTVYYFHGRDVAETARSLGCRPGTVKARLARGRALVARALGPEVGA
jgi:RNA polymerase sigma-70 factor (ECF subfamily)